MTCVAAYIDHDGRTAIACDTECGWGAHRVHVDTKLHRLGEWVVGFAGASLWQRFAREQQGLTSPEAFADAWLDWARTRGHGDSSAGHLHFEGTWLLAARGRLVLVGADGSLLEPVQPYAAIGSGAEVALGAMHALCPGGPAERVAEAAVCAAIRHSQGCGGDARALVL